MDSTLVPRVAHVRLASGWCVRRPDTMPDSERMHALGGTWHDVVEAWVFPTEQAAEQALLTTAGDYTPRWYAVG